MDDIALLQEYARTESESAIAALVEHHVGLVYSAARRQVRDPICLHGVCFPFIRCLGRESHNLWLGTVHAVRPTFTSESRRRFRFHHRPYWLGMANPNARSQKVK